MCEYKGYKEKYILFNSCINKKIHIQIQNGLGSQDQKDLEGCWKHYILYKSWSEITDLGGAWAVQTQFFEITPQSRAAF